jgi:hypothetical protein
VVGAEKYKKGVNQSGSDSSVIVRDLRKALTRSGTHSGPSSGVGHPVELNTSICSPRNILHSMLLSSSLRIYHILNPED